MLGVRLLVLLVACSSSSSTPPQAEQTAPQNPVSTPGPLIALGELTIRFENHPIARLHADGGTESVGNEKPGSPLSPGPKLHADGTIELKGGFKARVEADGNIVVVPPRGTGQPERVWGRIAGDQLLTTGTRDSGVRLEGAKLVMFYEGKPTNMLGEIDPPNMGRTALVMTAAFLIDMAITVN